MRRLCILACLAATVALACANSSTRSAEPAKSAESASKKAPVLRPSKAKTQSGMVLIKAGSFAMGCDAKADSQCIASDTPRHRVRLSAFYIDRHEVTASDYSECVKAKGCPVDDAGASPRLEHLNHTGSAVLTGTKPSRACNFRVKGRGNHPMNCVTRREASAYCHWRGKRLPSEAEWEMAAAGVKGRRYPWGATAPTCKLAAMRAPEKKEPSGLAAYEGGPLSRMSGLGGNSQPAPAPKSCGGDATMPVGSHAAGATPQGVHDLAGNVAEWVADTYGDGYYSRSPIYSPSGSTKGDLVNGIVRGGGWKHGARRLRTSDRGMQYIHERDATVGFRCVRTADSDPTCAGKPECAAVGACNVRDDDQCVPTSHESCRASALCKDEGACALSVSQPFTCERPEP